MFLMFQITVYCININFTIFLFPHILVIDSDKVFYVWQKN